MPSDITLDSHVNMYGVLTSCNHGKIFMGEYSKIGVNSHINCSNMITIGKDTAIASNTVIQDNNTHPVNPIDRRIMRRTPHGSDLRSWKHAASAPIIIGENVWIGEHVRICKGVTIGDNAIIAACSVVTKDVPANSVAAGNPAKIVKTDIDKSSTSVFSQSNED
ncbi:acyltransferase [Butyricimonas sp. NSJ-56]|uniref:Acyltransferase n=2 Tax=Butyricimonas TaxID=574697 RepID=A0ABR7D475_9BACT|nr:acyltransferase [Butyricimonas hominis]